MWPGSGPGLASLDVDSHPETPRTDRSNDTRFARRTLLRGGLGGLGVVTFGGSVLAACGGSNDTTSEGVTKGPAVSLLAMFPRDVHHVPAEVPFRLPYTLADDEGVPFASIESPLKFTVSFDGKQVGDPVEVAPRADGVPRPYLPLEFTFPRPGLYDVDVDFEGDRLNSQLQVFQKGEVRPPVVGDPLPSVNTPTTEQALEVDPICTRVPTCPFHAQDLAAALTSPRPIVVLLASPAYCRTSSCGPILDMLVEAVEGRDDLTVIHSEVYKNPKDVADLSEAALAPLPAEYAMPFEPCLFVTDSTHTIVARGDIAVDRTEMAEMLALAV